MPHINRIALVAICTATMALIPAVAQAKPPKIEKSQSLILNSHAKNISGYAGPLNTKGILPTGKLYVAEVSGSISYYAKKQYKHPSGNWDTVCGEPVYNAFLGGDVGIDAEFVFGRPWTSPCPEELPVHWMNFEISTSNGTSYSHPAPLGGPFTKPTPEHLYSYPLVGSNEYALFRLKDDPNGIPETADNYGYLYIHVRKAQASDCAGTGYAVFGEASEAACVAATS
jgi:hypothetical protein